jgi:hypothetical protein
LTGRSRAVNLPRMRGALLTSVIACAVAAATAQAQVDTPILDPGRDAIQPGMLVHIGDTSCTGGFVYDGTGLLLGRHYLGLAAHCVEDHIGLRVSDAAGRELGTVALSGWPYATYADDYAFVQLDKAVFPRVDPAMAGHAGVPTGFVPAGQGALGDGVLFSGWGFATRSKTATREGRPAVLKSHNDRFWFAEGIVSNTDSGGPVALQPTGGALGSVSNYCVPLPVNQSDGFEPGCFSWGPSVAYILDAARRRGFTVEVRAAAEGAPKPLDDIG